jgi:hypothetical protein
VCPYPFDPDNAVKEILPHAFDEHLLRELAPQVLGAVLRRFRDFATAEDAVQEDLGVRKRVGPADALLGQAQLSPKPIAVHVLPIVHKGTMIASALDWKSLVRFDTLEGSGSHRYGAVFPVEFFYRSVARHT